MQLSTRVVEVAFDAARGIHDITLQNTATGETRRDWAHVVINGTGILNNWKWPEIEGLHDFRGDKMHSAHWDHTVDLKDKVIGVIGTGSSSVQIVPQLQKVAKQVSVFMRGPTWISPPFGGGEWSPQTPIPFPGCGSSQRPAD
jgi:cation diffusion facilitator CzcD-associated flavoprotein CzcO